RRRRPPEPRRRRGRGRRAGSLSGGHADRAGDAGAADAAVAVRVLGKVLLVVVLGEVEVGGLGYFGGDGAVAGFGEDLLVGVAGGFGGLLLGVGAIEDRRTVLGADVVALAHALGGVVGLPEDAEQFFVGDLRRIVDDADGFGVARQAAADFLVGGVRGVAALVADGGGDDSRGLPERAFGAPEAAERELGDLGAVRVGRREGGVEDLVARRHRDGLVPPGECLLRRDHLGPRKAEHASRLAAASHLALASGFAYLGVVFGCVAGVEVFLGVCLDRYFCPSAVPDARPGGGAACATEGMSR